MTDEQWCIDCGHHFSSTTEKWWPEEEDADWQWACPQCGSPWHNATGEHADGCSNDAPHEPSPDGCRGREKGMAA